MKKVLFSDDYEEAARERLRGRKITNPSPQTLAKEIKVSFDKHLRELTNEVVDPKKQPETWLEIYKAECIKRFATNGYKFDKPEPVKEVEIPVQPVE